MIIAYQLRNFIFLSGIVSGEAPGLTEYLEHTREVINWVAKEYPRLDGLPTEQPRRGDLVTAYPPYPNEWVTEQDADKKAVTELVRTVRELKKQHKTQPI